MLIVAISIGVIFSQSVPPTDDMASQDSDISEQEPASNATTKALESIEDLINKSSQGKAVSKEDKDADDEFTSSEVLDGLAFSSKNTAKATLEAVKMEDPKDSKQAKLEEKPKEKQKKAPRKPRPKREILITKSSLEPNDDIATITYAELIMDGDQVILLLEGNDEIIAKTFVLEQPNRVVFDLEGKWAMEIPLLISNRMVKDIRLGDTGTHTRIVFDLKVKPIGTQIKQTASEKVQLVFE